MTMVLLGGITKEKRNLPKMARFADVTQVSQDERTAGDTDLAPPPRETFPGQNFRNLFT